MGLVPMCPHLAEYIVYYYVVYSIHSITFSNAIFSKNMNLTTVVVMPNSKINYFNHKNIIKYTLKYNKSLLRIVFHVQ